MTSKIIDSEGQPMILYHGTGSKFDEFSPIFSGTCGLPGAEYGDAYFFTDSLAVATEYASATAGKGGHPRVVAAQLNIENPLVFDFASDDLSFLNVDEDSMDDHALVQEELIAYAKENGFDGLITKNFDDGGDELITQYIAFSNTQIQLDTSFSKRIDVTLPNDLWPEIARSKLKPR